MNLGRTLAAGALLLVVAGGVGYLALNRRDDPETLAQQARAAFDARKFDQVEALVEKIETLREMTPEDNMLAAQAAMVRKGPDPAIAYLKKIPDSHPMASMAWLQIGQLELRRKRLRFAEEAYRKAIQLDPKQKQAYRELVYIFGYQTRRKEVTETFEKLQALGPLTIDDVFLWCLMRGVNWEAEENTKALRVYVEADADDRYSRLALAEALRQTTRLDDAESTLAPLPADDPDARSLRAMIALDKGDPAKAESLIAGSPEGSTSLAILRGRLALKKGDGPGAEKAFRSALQISPNLRDAILGLTQALRLAGKPAEAKTYTELVQKHDRLAVLLNEMSVPANRKDIRRLKELGTACAEIGRLPEARAWYSLALSVDPLDAESQEALFRLKP